MGVMARMASFQAMGTAAARPRYCNHADAGMDQVDKGIAADGRNAVPILAVCLVAKVSTSTLAQRKI